MPARLKKAELENPDWLRQKYWEEELTLAEIGKLLDCTGPTVSKRLKKFNIPLRPINAWCRLKSEELESPEWLARKYWGEGLSTHVIAEFLGCEAKTVLRRMREYNIPIRSHSQAISLVQGFGQYKNKEWLQDLYIEKELTSTQIAEQIGCHPGTVLRWLEEFGIPKREPGYHFRSENLKPSWDDGFFDELTPDGAYIIGFLIADGHISSHYANQGYSLGLAQKNAGILDKIMRVLSVKDDRCPIPSCDGSSRVALSSKHAWLVLVDRYGLPVGKEKSYVVRIPDCILERDDLLPHCIRGIFDGDGSVRESGRGFSFCSGSLKLLSDIAGILTRLVSLPSVEPQWRDSGFIKKNGENSGAYIISYEGILDAIDFARFIYGPDLDVYGSTLYLERKRKRFTEAYRKWNGGRKWLVAVLNDGWSPRQIADTLGIRLTQVSRQLKNLDGGCFVPSWHDRDWLFQRFVIEGKSVGVIAAEMPEAESKNICNFIKRYDLYQARSKYWNLELGI